MAAPPPPPRPSHIAPPLLLTPGEPAGIGPDLVVQLAREGALGDVCVVTDPALLEERARRLGVALEILPDTFTGAPAPGQVRVHALALAAPVQAGHIDPRNARHVLATLEYAADACLAGRAAALVTGPVHKAAINAAGIPFTGHTEFLAQRCGGMRPVMLLAAGSLRVALATTHLPLRAVPDAISTALVAEVLSIVDAGLRRWMGIASPRIAVCGLNPHAGEDGVLGDEDARVIAPAIQAARARGIDALGPLPADTAFTRPRVEGFDALLAMYHDQGLPVLKYAGFGHAVNITLGLPILRTSVDHGTALDLAGSGTASPASLRAALVLARELARRRPVAA